jgi:hypothetical protein
LPLPPPQKKQHQPGTGSATINCGGVLVRSNLVLTSAACLREKFGIVSDTIAGQPPPMTANNLALQVIAGAYYLDKPNDPTWTQGSIPVKEVRQSCRVTIAHLTG